MIKSYLYIKFAILIGLVAILSPHNSIAGLINYYPAIKGIVREKGTGKPIEGASVWVKYSYDLTFGFEPVYRLINVKEEVTNSKGEFKFSSYIYIGFPISERNRVLVNIYKPGYGYWELKNQTPDILLDISHEESFAIDNYMKPKKVRIINTPSHPIHGRDEYLDVILGYAELPIISNYEDRRRILGSDVEREFMKNTPYLKKLIQSEEEYLYNVRIGKNQKPGKILINNFVFGVPPSAAGITVIDNNRILK